MSEFAEFPFDTTPRITFIEEALGLKAITPEEVGLYHAEAVNLASKICTSSIEKFRSGSLEYNRVLSEPVPYKTTSGDEAMIGLALMAGPENICDERIVEIVELGVFVRKEDALQFVPLAEIREGYVKTGGLMRPRVNNPEDLDSFMRGARYIASMASTT